jgi:periplasmic divalent cation tolerance protein
MYSEPSHEPDDGVVGVYLTFPDVATAARVAEVLVAERLAACVNLLPPATSVYRWDGRVVREEEVVAWAKTTRGRLSALSSAVETHHPYDVPCVVAYPAVGGSAAYLDWVRDEVSAEGASR